MELVINVYKLSEMLLKEEKFYLRKQMKYIKSKR